MYSTCGSAASAALSATAAASPLPVRTRCNPGTLRNSCDDTREILPRARAIAAGGDPVLNLTRNSPGTAASGGGVWGVGEERGWLSAATGDCCAVTGADAA